MQNANLVLGLDEHTSLFDAPTDDVIL